VIKKRWLISIMCFLVVLAFVLAACGRQTSTDTGEPESPPSSSSGEETGKETSEVTEKPKEKVTFTMFVAVQGKKDMYMNETRIGKILEEQTGVNFKVEYLVGELQTKIGTMIASGDYPDVLVPDDGIEAVVQAGGFIDLTPYIDNDKYPNIKKVYGPLKERMRWDDGTIPIFVFSTQVGEFQPDPGPNMTAFWIQRRVLEWAGFPRLKTVDQYFEVIENFVKAHPDEKLIGFTTLTDDWRFFATTNAPNHLAGYPNDGEVMVDLKTYEARIYAGTEWDKRWWKKLNEVNAKGLFDRAAFTDNYDQYIAKLTSHRVLGMCDQAWQIGNAQAALRDAAKANPAEDGYRYFPLPIVFDETIKDQYLDPVSFVKNRGWGITVKCKDPERVIEFVDHLLKEETQILVKWGVEGETYLRDKNGRMYRTQEMIDKMDQKFNDEYGFTMFGWDWPHWGTSSTLSDGNAAVPGRQPEIFELSLTEADKKFFKAYGIRTYADLFTPPDPRPWYPAWGIPRGPEQQLFEQQKADIQRKYIPKLVLSKPEDFDKVWEEYTAALNKLDIAGYERWFTQQIKEIVGKASAK